MQIQIVSVGKPKRGFHYLEPGIADYQKRLRAYVTLSMTEVAETPIVASRTPAQIMASEAERLAPYLARASMVVALSERGEALGSEAFARKLSARIDRDGIAANPSNGGALKPGSGLMMFVVGGPIGLCQSVIDRSDWVLSLSPMTFPHPLVRLFLLEQLYRAFKIIRNEPYHK